MCGLCPFFMYLQSKVSFVVTGSAVYFSVIFLNQGEKESPNETISHKVLSLTIVHPCQREMPDHVLAFKSWRSRKSEGML